MHCGPWDRLHLRLRPMYACRDMHIICTALLMGTPTWHRYHRKHKQRIWHRAIHGAYIDCRIFTTLCRVATGMSDSLSITRSHRFQTFSLQHRLYVSHLQQYLSALPDSMVLQFTLPSSHFARFSCPLPGFSTMRGATGTHFTRWD